MQINLDTVFPLMTFIATLYLLKIQNKKINFQSEIIKDQENYNKFFDVDKLKNYMELCNLANDKHLNLERQSLQQEFKLQKINFLLKQSKNKNFSQVIEIEEHN